MTAGRRLSGEPIAEALALVIVVGDSVAAVLLLDEPSPYLNASCGVAISVNGPMPGRHASPAETLYRGFSPRQVVPSVVA